MLRAQIGTDTAGSAIDLAQGPHLFVDDFLIGSSEGFVRTVVPPKRLGAPVLDSRRFGTTQPYGSVVRNDETGRHRFWYNRGSAIWMTESTDGVEWGNPREAWGLPRAYGASLIDDRERTRDPNRRYKLANWRSTKKLDDTPADDSGMYVGFSGDGISWTDAPQNPVLRTWPEGYGKISRHGVGDTVDAYYDPIRRRYAAAVKVHSLREEGMAPGPKAGTFTRRLVGVTHSEDFVNWDPPRRIAVPDARDPGLLEFYGMGGVHARGRLLIGFVRVLRDDVPAEPGGSVDGVGYTVLATSRDGLIWTRDREPFLDRSTTPGVWDRAMAWVSAVQPMGAETFLYYGGYARGHKIAPFTERQIGLARFPRDRYIALRAAVAGATLVTPKVRLDGAGMTVNASIRGNLRVAIRGERLEPLPGFEESAVLRGDSLEHRCGWRSSLAALRGRPVRLEFAADDADLFGFELLPARIT